MCVCVCALSGSRVGFPVISASFNQLVLRSLHQLQYNETVLMMINENRPFKQQQSVLHMTQVNIFEEKLQSRPMFWQSFIIWQECYPNAVYFKCLH